MDPLVEQLVQVAGALLILAAFILAQARLVDQHGDATWCRTRSAPRCCACSRCSAQWGFVLLEGAWALVSA